MKKLFLLGLVLVACSDVEVAPQEGNDAMSLPAPQVEGESTPVAAAEATTPPAMESSSESALSMPVDAEKAPEVSAQPTVAKTEINSEPSPMESPKISMPESSLPPPAGMKAKAKKEKDSGPKKSIYEQYDDYRATSDARMKEEEEFKRRELFAHEDGAFQLGFDYAYKPFREYDYDRTGGVKKQEATGGVISFGYFPFRSLDYGRAGLSLAAGGYWARYENFVAGRVDASRKLAFVTFGGRATYELQVWLAQMVVPFAFYGYEQIRYQGYSLAAAGVDYKKNTFNAQNYGGGFHFNLNRLEPYTASSALVSSGVRKFYITYTALQRISEKGLDHYLGLRFEF